LDDRRRQAKEIEELVEALKTATAIIHQQGSCTDTRFDNGMAKIQQALTHAEAIQKGE
jgi:hypothetical protein